MLDDVAPASKGKSRDWRATQQVIGGKNEIFRNESSYDSPNSIASTIALKRRIGFVMSFSEYCSIWQVVRAAGGGGAMIFWGSFCLISGPGRPNEDLKVD